MTIRLKCSRTGGSLAFFLLGSVLLGSGPTAAEVDAGGFLKMMEEHHWSARTYLMGVVTGLETANAATRQRFGSRLFCAPDGKPLTHERQIEILNDHLTLHPGDRDRPISRVVTDSLVRRYPCTPPPDQR